MAIPYHLKCKRWTQNTPTKSFRGPWTDPKIQSKGKEESLVENLENSDYKIIFAWECFLSRSLHPIIEIQKASQHSKSLHIYMYVCISIHKTEKKHMET